jgi:hypothetical protein
MTEFLRENSTFIAGLVFLVALIAGASMLQTAHGAASTALGSTVAPQALSSAVDNGVGWHIITTASAPVVAPKPTSSAAPKARHRLYNESRDDDN